MSNIYRHPIAIEHQPPAALKPYGRNARRHSKSQVRQIAESIRRSGFTNPILTSDGNEIIAGHERVDAAKLIGLETIPTVRLSHLDETELRVCTPVTNQANGAAALRPFTTA